MPSYDLFVPFKTSRHDGFFNVEPEQARSLLGCTVRLLKQTPYHYVILERVDEGSAPELLGKLRRLMPWASLRLDFSILIEAGDVQVSDSMIFNGHIPTLAQAGASPIRADSNHRTEEGDLRLFSALQEAETLPRLTGRDPDQITMLALELFASVDFEATSNAQFLTLTSALEILSRPGDRPSNCIDLINQLVAKVDQALPSAQGSEKKALEDMRSTASQFWIKQSFTSAIRSVAARTASVIGVESPEDAGRAATSLYRKRSRLVHGGIAVNGDDVRKIRQLVREVISVELNCYHHIRERYPTN